MCLGNEVGEKDHPFGSAMTYTAYRRSSMWMWPYVRSMPFLGYQGVRAHVPTWLCALNGGKQAEGACLI